MPAALWEDLPPEFRGAFRGTPGPLAQLAEQRTFNPTRVGSSPTGPTTTRRNHTVATSSPAVATRFVQSNPSSIVSFMVVPAGMCPA